MDKMMILAWILLLFGIIEVGANSLFLVKAKTGNDFTAAKTFHGDFPKNASDTEWICKIWVMWAIGGLALISSEMIFTHNRMMSAFISLSAAGMLAVGVFQAIKYGSKHMPSFGSLLIGAVFAVICYLLGFR